MPELVAHIRADARALAAAASSDPGAAIVRYPGWTQLDLLVHTGSVHRRTIELVRTRSLERLGRVFPPDEEWSTVLPWFEEGALEMADLLEHTDPRTPVWAFGPDHSVGSWRVRMALETTVHRWDAERATGTPDPIDARLAERGISEFGMMWAGSIPTDGLVGSLSLRGTDGEHGWVMDVVDGVARLASGPADAEVVVAGTASNLYLWLLGRVPLEVLEITGDPAAWDLAIHALPDARR